jgi:hypothetical protein
MKLDWNGWGSISCFSELDKDNELCLSRPGTTRGLYYLRYCRTRVEIIFNVETCGVVGAGKGKTPMSKESLRRPTLTLSRLDCPRKGTSFIVALWRSGVI